MPAAVIPAITVQYGLQIEHDGRWICGCAECEWWPEPYFDRAVASGDAYQHNVHRHEGADVVMLRDYLVTMAEQGVQRMRYRERTVMLVALSYTLFMTVLGYRLDPWFGLTVLMLIGIVLFYGHLWGWRMAHRTHAQQHLERLRDAFERDLPEMPD